MNVVPKGKVSPTNEFVTAGLGGLMRTFFREKFRVGPSPHLPKSSSMELLKATAELRMFDGILIALELGCLVLAAKLWGKFFDEAATASRG